MTETTETYSTHNPATQATPATVDVETIDLWQREHERVIADSQPGSYAAHVSQQMLMLLDALTAARSEQSAAIQRLREWLDHHEQTATAHLRLAVDVTELRAVFDALDAYAALVERALGWRAAYLARHRGQDAVTAAFAQHGGQADQSLFDAVEDLWELEAVASEALVAALASAAPQPAALTPDSEVA